MRDYFKKERSHFLKGVIDSSCAGLNVTMKTTVGHPKKWKKFAKQKFKASEKNCRKPFVLKLFKTLLPKALENYNRKIKPH